MTGKTKKIILFSVLGILVTAAAVGYKMYNKTHFSVENTMPAAEISAADLHQTFSSDSIFAKNKFIGDETNQKIIKVTGEVSDIRENQLKHVVIKLKTATEGAFINCEMEGRADNILVGNKIAVKGICSGYLFDAEMGIPGDVNLNRCFIVK